MGTGGKEVGKQKAAPPSAAGRWDTLGLRPYHYLECYTVALSYSLWVCVKKKAKTSGQRGAGLMNGVKAPLQSLKPALQNLLWNMIAPNSLS